MTQSQVEFLEALEAFILSVEGMKTFKGKTQALSTLRRLRRLSVFR